MIIERSFMETPEATSIRGKKPPASAAPLTGKAAKNAWGGLEAQLGDRTKALLTKYRILRPSDYGLAVKLKLNKDEEMEVIEEVPEDVPVVDPKKKK